MKGRVLPLIISLAFTAGGIFLLLRGDKTAIWPTLFFGFCSIIILLAFIYPDHFWVWKPKVEKSFEERLNEDGIFTFNDDGFTIEHNRTTHQIAWAEIECMFGYKQDLYSIDRICLDVFCENGAAFCVDEDTAGWFQFLQRSKAAMPSIDIAWEIEISVPAFETKLTLVYDKHGRTQEEVFKQIAQKRESGELHSL